MNILHVLNAPDGGATSSAIGIVRASRREETGINHYAVYPGVDQSKAITNAFHDSASIPMRWWSKTMRAGTLRRPIRWLLDIRRTRFDILPRTELQRLIEKWGIDIVHTNTAIIRDGAVIARKLGIPHIWHIREPIGSEGTHKFYLSDENLAHYIANHSERILCVSEYTAGIFRKYGYDNKVEVVHNAINVSEFGTESSVDLGKALRDSLGIKSDEKLVAMVASPATMWKSHDLFINVASELSKLNKNVRFAIFGTLPGKKSWLWNVSYKYYANLLKQIDNLGMASRFLFPGQHKSEAIMNAIDLLVHPCSEEGFGRIAIEAMAAAKPVVGPKTGGISEIVTDGVDGRHVDFNNPGAAAAVINGILTDPSLYEMVCNAGLKKANSAFNDNQLLTTIIRNYRASIQSYAGQIQLVTK